MSPTHAPNVPLEHNAAIFDNIGHISTKIVKVPTPQPGPGELLVRLTHSGVCHSDYGIMTNSPTYPRPCPPDQIGGHEGVGVVVQLGPPATHEEGMPTKPFAVADRIGVKWIQYFCDQCPMCRSGAPTACVRGKASGYFSPGTFQEYVAVSARCSTKIPEGVSSAEAAPMLCAGLTVYSALKKSKPRKGEWLVVMGAGGGLGHLACQIASRGFGQRVIGVDGPSKESIVLESGAEVFLPLAKDDSVLKRVVELTDGGANSVLVCAAANEAYAQAVDMLRHHGAVICVGIPEARAPIAGSIPVTIIAKSLQIFGSSVGTQDEAEEVMDLVARGVVKVHHRLEPLQRLTSVFEEMHSGKLAGRVVLDLDS